MSWRTFPGDSHHLVGFSFDTFGSLGVDIFSWIPPLLSHSIFPKESSVPILWMPWGTAIFSFYPGLMWFGTPRDGN